MTTKRGELFEAEAPGARAHTVALGIRGALAALADLLLPPVCISCRKHTLSHGLLCGPCWSRIDFIAPPICARLGVPLRYDTGEPSLSAVAVADPPVYDRARAAARYSATMRDLIQSFKYGDRHEGVAVFALRLSGVAVDYFLLARVKRTPSQVGLTAAQRRRNVAGAFRVLALRPRINGKRIVVVDDVITTGATADACARVLKRRGTARVDVLALARAVEPSAFLL